jgi:uncharacterized protein (DUF1330 family)
MAAYVVVEVSVTDPQTFQEYRKLTPSTVQEFGGRFIVLGGQKQPLEGDWQGAHVALIEFPTIERANEWYNSPAYARAKAIRQKSARTKMIILQGS